LPTSLIQRELVEEIIERRSDREARFVVDPSLLAGLDVLDLEIAPVGHDRDALHWREPLSPIDGRTTHHPGYAISQHPQARRGGL
jgi:hypothetical protein